MIKRRGIAKGLVLVIKNEKVYNVPENGIVIGNLTA